MDKNIENDVIKCSRCGLCADVCPVYTAKPAEGALLRGKFLQILGVLRGDLKYSNPLKSSIDYCLGCEKCKSACPSAIDALNVFETLKYSHFNVVDKILYGKFFFKIKILILKIFYRVKHPVKSILRGQKHNVQNPAKKLTHFNGCLSRCINVDFRLPFRFSRTKFECCGIPFKTKGNLDEYRRLANSNIEKIEKTDGLVVFNCATCLSSVLSYEFKSPKTRERLVFYTSIYEEMLKTHNFSSKTPVTVTFHNPCHLKSAGVSLSHIENILNSIENVTYKRLENPDDCCGFGGDFFLRHPKTADILSSKRADEIINSGAKIVLTACPTCLWSLKYSLNKRRRRDIKAYDLAEFLYSLKITKKN